MRTRTRLFVPILIAALAVGVGPALVASPAQAAPTDDTPVKLPPKVSTTTVPTSRTSTSYGTPTTGAGCSPAMSS